MEALIFLQRNIKTEQNVTFARAWSGIKLKIWLAYKSIWTTHRSMQLICFPRPRHLLVTSKFVLVLLLECAGTH